MTSELGIRMLQILAKRGYRGADREAFFQNIRGMRYNQLEMEILSLEQEGYISINWVGPSNFAASITQSGLEFTRLYQEDTMHEDNEDLNELNDVNHEESGVQEDVEYYHNIPETMAIEDVDELPKEAIEETHEQMIIEQETSYEESTPIDSGVSAEEELIENESLGTDVGVLEGQISGEIDNAFLMASQQVEDEGHGATLSTGGEKGDDISCNPDAIVEDILPPDFFKEIEALLDYEEDTGQETDVKTVANPNDTHCFWEEERECPILKSNEMDMDFTLTSNPCVVCQLLEIKSLLKRIMLKPTQ